MSGVRVPLEVLRIETPCTEDWNAMAGDERSRYCAGCGLHVHNLSAMTRDEAERLVCERAGRLCVRYGRSPAGGVVTLDYSPPRQGRKWTFWAMLGGAGALAAAVLNVFAARSRPNTAAPMGMVLMGDVGPATSCLETAPQGPSDPAEFGGEIVMGEAMPLEPLVTVPPAPLGPPAPERDQDGLTADPR